MAIKDFARKMDEANERIGGVLERALGKCLDQPFTSANSGPRKLMFAIHHDHACSLWNRQTSAVSTGFENRWGDLSSSIVQLDDDVVVLDKISRYSSNPQHRYYVLYLKRSTNTIEVVERKYCEHTAESHGFLYDNDILDRLEPSMEIPRGNVIKKSMSFDEYMNRCDCGNLQTLYLSCDGTMEDSYMVDDEASEILAVPLVHEIPAILNENDIPLLIHKNPDGTVKALPDIGEVIGDGILLAVRTENDKELLYMQSRNRLKSIMMSDDKYIVDGVVADIEVYCNNIDNLNNNPHYTQIKALYEDKIRFVKEFLLAINRYRGAGYTLSYDVQKMVSDFNKILNGAQYIKDKQFSNVLIEFTIVEKDRLKVGDKVSNRHGGKGVVSKVIPSAFMPITDTGRRINIIVNKSTCTNRENGGQLIENESTYIGQRILDWICVNKMDAVEGFDLVMQYLRIISPVQCQFLEDQLRPLHPDDKLMFKDSLLDDMMNAGHIKLSLLPIQESLTIDDLDRLYQAFPFVDQCYLQVPIVDSNGNTRFIKSLRKAVPGTISYYRLKQYAKEKFSATALSSVNLRNENAKSKASKNFKSPYPNTPVKFGDMESGDLGHLGMENVITNLMVLSLSPHARRLTKSLMTNPDPFDIDIKLDKYSTNRSVEKFMVYMKTIGLRVKFVKKKKEIQPAFIQDAFRPLTPAFTPLVQPFEPINKEESPK